MANYELNLIDERKTTTGPLIVLFATITTEAYIYHWHQDMDSPKKPIKYAKMLQKAEANNNRPVATNFRVRRMTFAETDAAGYTAGVDVV